MDKEKEIQEMADIAEVYCSNHFDEKLCVNEDECNKCTYCALAEAGYRKADEVRKETAKEIALEINSTIDCVSAPEIPLLLDILQFLKEEYGVGVD